jgi:hypothetical protein
MKTEWKPRLRERYIVYFEEAIGFIVHRSGRIIMSPVKVKVNNNKVIGLLGAIAPVSCDVEVPEQYNSCCSELIEQFVFLPPRQGQVAENRKHQFVCDVFDGFALILRPKWMMTEAAAQSAFDRMPSAFGI